MYNTIQIKRRLQGSLNTGIPTLSGGELAYNEKTDELYYGGEFGTLTIAGSGAFVDRATAQTISGYKTFSGLTTLSSTTFSAGSIIDAGNNTITNVLDPVNAQDVATRNYVDTASSNITSALTSLSAEVYNNFVEKIESEAVALNGGLTVTNGISSDSVKTSGNVEVGGNLTVTGDFTVLGDISTLETTTSVTSAFSITNAGSTTALVVNQTGSTNIAEFQDDGATAFIIVDGGNVGVGTATPNEKLTVVGNISATGTIYADSGLLVNGGGVDTTLYVEDGLVGINTETPNEALTVVGNISASQNIYAVNGDFTGTLDADGATTLGSTLYVTNAATFASSVSAAGAVDFDLTLDVVGATTLQSTLDVTSTATFFADISGQAGVSYINDFIIDGGSF
jgi:ethanolamine utilization microcompartment shell protein EutS